MDNIHKGHRQRLKDRFLKEGLENFSDVHVLELLLFYAIPRKDTNPIAHRLLATFGSLAAGAFAGLVGGIAFACLGHIPAGMMMLAGGMVCAGVSILMFHGCKAATKGILLLTKKFAVWMKNRWMKKEEAV